MRTVTLTEDELKSETANLITIGANMHNLLAVVGCEEAKVAAHVQWIIDGRIAALMNRPAPAGDGVDWRARAERAEEALRRIVSRSAPNAVTVTVDSSLGMRAGTRYNATADFRAGWAVLDAVAVPQPHTTEADK